ncbi:MAG: hypothetical protein WAT09_01035 [Paracoccaceae bacterium]
MLLRIIVFLGLGLVLAGFGAAGWQYWQGLPVASDVVVVEAPLAETADDSDADTKAETAIEPGQAWLISAAGGLVPRRDARAFLQQGKFVENRDVTLSVRLPLSSLLSLGEGLPGEPYLEAFAEVRAGVAGQQLCQLMQAAWAKDCALYQVQLKDKSYDPQTQTAVFLVGAVYTQKAEAQALPDLSTRVFVDQRVRSDADKAGPAAATPAAFMAYVIKTAGEICAVDKAADRPCRVLGMSVEWMDPTQVSSTIRVGRLGPLPKGIYPAPPLF